MRHAQVRERLLDHAGRHLRVLTPAAPEEGAGFRLLLLCLLTVGVLAQVLHVPLLPWLVLAYLVMRILPGPTHAAAGLLALPVVAGALCTWLTLASWAGVRSSASVLLSAGLVLSTALALRAAGLRRAWRPLDAASLIAGVATAAILLRPFIGVTPGWRLTLLSRTADAATHLQMTRAAGRAGGYFMLAPTADLAGTRGISEYPPGFSGLMAVLVPTPPRPELTEGLTGVIVVACVIAGLLAALSVQVAGEALGDGDASWPRSLALCVTVTGLTVLGPVALMFADGAYAQLLATTAVLAGLVLVQQGTDRAAAVTACLALATVVAFHAWYLLVPALAVPWLLHLPKLRERTRVAAVVVAVAAPVCAYPIVNGPGRSHLRVAGFIDLPETRALWALLLATMAALVVMLLRPLSRRGQLPLLGTLVATLVFAVALGVVQISQTGSLSYYFFKIALGAAALAVPVIAAATLGFVARAGRHRTLAQTTAAGALCGLTLALASSPALSGPAAGTLPRQLVGGLQQSPHDQPAVQGPRVAAYLDGLLHDRHDVPSGHDQWLVACDRAQMYVVNKWLYDLSLSWTPQRQYVLDSMRFPSRDLGHDLLERTADPELRTMHVTYDPRCSPTWLEALGARPGVTLAPLR